MAGCARDGTLVSGSVSARTRNATADKSGAAVPRIIEREFSEQSKRHPPMTAEAELDERQWQPDRHLEMLMNHPGFLIRRAFQIYCGVYEDVLGDLGLSHAQWVVLVTIGAFRGIDQTQLARAAGIDKTSSGRAVDRMVADGIIQVTHAPADRRRKRLSLTEHGTALLARAHEGAARFREAILERLEPEDRAALLEALRTFVRAYDDRSRASLEMPRRHDSG